MKKTKTKTRKKELKLDKFTVSKISNTASIKGKDGGTGGETGPSKWQSIINCR